MPCRELLEGSGTGRHGGPAPKSQLRPSCSCASGQRSLGGQAASKDVGVFSYRAALARARRRPAKMLNHRIRRASVPWTPRQRLRWPRTFTSPRSTRACTRALVSRCGGCRDRCQRLRGQGTRSHRRFRRLRNDHGAMEAVKPDGRVVQVGAGSHSGTAEPRGGGRQAGTTCLARSAEPWTTTPRCLSSRARENQVHHPYQI